MKLLNPTLRLLVILLTIFSLTSSTQRTKWKKYKNKHYGFSIKFPKNYEIAEQHDKDGKTLSVQHFNNHTSELYYVSVYESNDQIDIHGLEEVAVKTFTQEVDGALLSLRNLDNGRKEAIIGLDETTFIFYQVDISDDALYQIICTHHQSDKDVKLSNYFDSFEILK